MLQVQTSADITALYDRHVDTVYRVCYSFMKNEADTEDMVQETFLRLLRAGHEFQSTEHEKAWLIVTASNLCKDSLKKWWRKCEDIDSLAAVPQAVDSEAGNMLCAILELPAEYKTVVYLYYYEGCTTSEIASQLRCPDATVRSRLARARKLLKTILGGESHEKQAHKTRV